MRGEHLHGLVLDIGDVILDPRRAIAAFVPVGTVVDGDWERIAREAGYDSWRSLFRAMTARFADDVFDPDAVALMHDARKAGHRVGALSNDAYAIQGPAFFASRPEFAALDAFVDSTDIGARKPDPTAYRAAATALHLVPEEIVFLDDTPECVDGARAIGMAAVLVDPLDRRSAFAEARRLLGMDG
jgi:HAD superfamily hydrolase (TIGR01509 family)